MSDSWRHMASEYDPSRPYLWRVTYAVPLVHVNVAYNVGSGFFQSVVAVYDFLTDWDMSNEVDVALNFSENGEFVEFVTFYVSLSRSPFGWGGRKNLDTGMILGNTSTRLVKEADMMPEIFGDAVVVREY